MVTIDSYVETKAFMLVMDGQKNEATRLLRCLFPNELRRLASQVNDLADVVDKLLKDSNEYS